MLTPTMRNRGEEEIDEEAPAPRGPLGERPAEYQADRGARTSDDAVDGKGGGSLLGFGERHRQRGERGRGQQRAERSLNGARHDEHGEGVRRAADRGRDGESREPHVERGRRPHRSLKRPPSSSSEPKASA